MSAHATGRTVGSARPRLFSRMQPMRSHPSARIPVVAGCGHDRPSALLRTSSGAASAYSCESCHLRLIMAACNRQNGSKALRAWKIGQNKKKLEGRLQSVPLFFWSFIGESSAADGWRRAANKHIRASSARKQRGCASSWLFLWYRGQAHNCGRGLRPKGGPPRNWVFRARADGVNC